MGDADSTVLRPVETYAELLREIDRRKQHARPTLGPQVFVAAVGGVGVDGDVTLKDALDPTWQTQFGIGPGCASAAGRASPPVRLAELAREFSEFGPWGGNSLVSICQTDWTPALACVPGYPQVVPCIDACFADADPTTERLDIAATVEWESPEGERQSLPPCVVTEGETVVPPGHVACAQLLPAGQGTQCQDAAGAWLAAFADGPPRGCLTFTVEVDPHGVACTEGW